MEYGFAEYKEKEIIRDHLNMGGSNPAGERIDVTSKYLTKGGRPWLPVMGEYHFARARKEEWYDELLKMKAGGIGIVSTYLFWIYHEEEEGVLDFGGDLDIGAFVRDAGRAGLYVILRLGPWAHGECRNGGFPDWLVKKPFRIRDNSPEYLELCRKWYAAIFEQVSGMLYKDGGNIIGIQLDNELTDNAEHLKALKDIAREVGFDVPLYTVTGWNSLYGAHIPVDDVLPVFGAYPDAPWEPGTHKLPLSRHYSFYTMRNDTAIGKDLIKQDGNDWQLPYDRYPFATCELGPGMMSTHHRRVLISAMDAYAMSLVKLGCGNNLVGYYMFHGGTNRVGKHSTFNETTATGYPNDYPILNYDFQTCISQYGEIRESYRRLNLLHLFVNDFGGILAEMDHVAAASFVPEDDLSGLRYCMRRKGDSGFIFVNNHQRGAALGGHRNVTFVTGEGTDVKISVDVPAESAFILPFNLDMTADPAEACADEADCAKEGTLRLRYATAQLLCRETGEDGKGCVYYFIALGEKARYDFGVSGTCEAAPGKGSRFTAGKDGHGRIVEIVTLSEEEALRLRKVNGRVFFEENDPGADSKTGLEAEECAPAFSIEGEELRQLKLSVSPESRIIWKKISAKAPEGFCELDEGVFGGKYDVAQIYADGALIADNYSCGASWRVPASMLHGREVYLVYST